MLPKTVFILGALVALFSGISCRKQSNIIAPPQPASGTAGASTAGDSIIDIDFYNKPMGDDPTVTGSGSGTDKTEDDDDDDGSPDEDDFGSGSGSGEGRTVPKPGVPTTTTTSKPLTPCEQLRRASKDLIGNYIPRCTKEGDYDTMQCRGYPGTGNCWCSDLDGRMIPSTNMGQPNVPDCELGSNLKPCVFEIVKFSRKRLLGTYRPNCTIEGYFKSIQCEGSMCFCVTPYGKKITGTEVFINDTPKCSSLQDTTLAVVVNPQPTTTTTTTQKVPVVVVEEIDKTDNSETENSEVDEPETEYTESPEDGTNVKPLPESEDDITLEGDGETLVGPVTHIMTQPGLLAAIIAGAVVTLLCAILLIMFIVYRMRKKDEGSYALDEPRKMPNYSYHRAEKDKEFYA